MTLIISNVPPNQKEILRAKYERIGFIVQFIN